MPDISARLGSVPDENAISKIRELGIEGMTVTEVKGFWAAKRAHRNLPGKRIHGGFFAESESGSRNGGRLD